VTLFQFGRTIWCTCGERVALAPRERGAPTPTEVRFFADAMLARLARWLRIAGYDTRYHPHVEDADLVRIAIEEGRFILTRDRALPQEWSVEDVLELDAEDPLQQLREVAAHFPLDWRARAFSRCSRCNALVASIAPDESAQSIPKGVLAQRLAFTRCPECGRTYWEGSHTERMRRVLARALGPDPESMT
jgi:hypothetical protein